MSEPLSEIIEGHAPPAPLQFGTLKLDRATRIVSRHGTSRSLYLPPTAARLLAGFMLAPVGYLTHAASYEVLYWDRGEAAEPEPNTVTVHICNLRKALDRLGQGVALETIWGKAYQLKVTP